MHATMGSALAQERTGVNPSPQDLALAGKHGFRAHGTTRMIAGSLVGAVAAYLFQVLGGRRLGTTGFAPIALLWTVFFIVATVVLVPLEQFVTREVSRGRKILADDRGPLLTVIIATSLALAVFVAVTNEHLFAGNPVFILQAALLTALFGAMQVGKGILAGHRHFALYGLVLSFEGIFRLAAAGVVLWIAATAGSLGWAMVAAPLCILLARPWRFDRHSAPGEVSRTRVSGFLGSYVVGSAASQLLLAGAPIWVVVLGGNEALRSVIFVTFTLYRAPLTLIYNLQGRVLSLLVRMNGDQASQVRRFTKRVVVGGAALSVLAAAVGWLIGPAIVGLLFGADFRPEPLVASLVAAGVIVASATQILGQALVATGSTGQLAGAWAGGLGAGLLAMVLAGGGVGPRVGLGFLVGEVVAFLLACLRVFNRR
jgi:O-antigen/teichoic acid export membrane protein